MSESIRIVVGSDICPGDLDQHLFAQGDVETLLGPQRKLWQDADYALVNLECPLTTAGKRIKKFGPHLKAGPECAHFFPVAGIDAVALANNHIRDYGDEGVLDTLAACQSRGTATVGAGANLKAARKPLITERRGLQFAILAMSEMEFNLADEHGRAGANPLDFENASILAALSKELDAVIVILHAGNEFYPYPRPGLVNTCRALVDLGASAVVMQHSHCVGCMETYRGAPIVLGQGNFIFSAANQSPPWYEGMTIELILSKSVPAVCRYHPFRQSREEPGIREPQPDEAVAFEAALRYRSEMLADETALQDEWCRYCESMFAEKMDWLFGMPGLGRRGIRWSAFLVDTVLNKMKMYNMLVSDSHRDALRECLESRINDDS